MLRNVVAKVAWVGRTASVVFGLALVLGLVFGATTIALGANGDNFILGSLQNTATAVTKITGNANSSTLQVVNNNADPNDTALDLRVQAGEAPMRVNSTGKVANLNADQLDGQEAGALAESRGYAHVDIDGDVDTDYPSKGVNDVLIPTGETSVYCFDLAFTPKTAVGSPFFNNSAVVATATPPSPVLTSICPATHRDAAVKTYGSSDGAGVPINFQVVFE